MARSLAVRPEGYHAVGSDLPKRILSAAVLAPIVLLLIIAGGWWFAALIVVAAFLMLREWDEITGGVGGGPIFVCSFLAVFLALLAAQIGYPAVAGGSMLIGCIAVAIVARQVHPERIWWPVLGILWIGLPCVALTLIAKQGPVPLITILWLMVTVWACDIGAYFAGRTIGGPKIWPAVSPKKTWAGLFGGMLASAVVGAMFAAWTGLAEPVVLAGVGALLAAFSQVGDFAQSAFKRHFGVKDSGDIIPGHGGILDRVDGLLFAIVLAFAIAVWRGGSILPWL